MSDHNTLHNRAVWFDIPVTDLDRAIRFYTKVLAIGVTRESFDGTALGVLEHDGEGNGGCLVPGAGEATASGGLLVYLNVDGRIRDAVAQTAALGGRVLQPIHSIGPHGFRAIVVDSEGNRVALHSQSDA